SDETTKISAVEAKKIAANYVKEPGASTEAPTLSIQDSKLVYTVPVVCNGTNVGEIYIDAQTGKNLGGVGGAP
ncbi:MAG: PepSY domain-containing protein, partial [Methanobacterium sp.]